MIKPGRLTRLALEQEEGTGLGPVTVALITHFNWWIAHRGEGLGQWMEGYLTALDEAVRIAVEVEGLPPEKEETNA